MARDGSRTFVPTVAGAFDGDVVAGAGDGDGIDGDDARGGLDPLRGSKTSRMGGMDRYARAGGGALVSPAFSPATGGGTENRFSGAGSMLSEGLGRSKMPISSISLPAARSSTS